MKKYVAAATVIVLITAAVFAQADKNLVGTWKMDGKGRSITRSMGANLRMARVTIGLTQRSSKRTARLFCNGRMTEESSPGPSTSQPMGGR